MTSKTISMLAAATLAVVTSMTAAPARAGDLSNAQAACYVDTYAYDDLEPGQCYGGWTPYSADNPTVAVFEVTGLPAGDYTYVWTDRDNAQVVCSGVPYCWRSIGLNQTVRFSVLVHDTQTSASKLMNVDATFYDAWH